MGNREYDLKFTLKAQEDLDQIYDYIYGNHFAPEAA